MPGNLKFAPFHFGRTDGQPENIMPLAPKGADIKTVASDCDLAFGRLDQDSKLPYHAYSQAIIPSCLDLGQSLPGFDVYLGNGDLASGLPSGRKTRPYGVITKVRGLYHNCLLCHWSKIYSKLHWAASDATRVADGLALSVSWLDWFIWGDDIAP